MKTKMKFSALLVCGLLLVACGNAEKDGKSTSKENQTATITYQNYEPGAATLIAEPETKIASDTREATAQPTTQDQATADVEFILQSFYYESGAPKRQAIFNKSDEELLDEMTNFALSYLGETLGTTAAYNQTVEVGGTTYTFGDEMKKRLRVSLNSLQLSNYYELTSVAVEDSNVTVQVNVRSIDKTQYSSIVKELPEEERTKASAILEKMNSLDANVPEQAIERKIYETILLNKAVTIPDKENEFYRVPLSATNQLIPLTFHFTYDEQGNLTVPEAALMALTRIKYEQ